jgi:inorganic pyrophosphatase
MTELHRLPTKDKDGNIQVVVEASKGSIAKCKYDPELGVFVFGRPLAHGLAYPFDWGFIPSTKGGDGDPLDALVLHDAACPVGCIIPCRLIGVLQIEQKPKDGKSQRNDRYMLVPASDEAVPDDVLTDRLKQELEQFFHAAVMGLPKTLTMLGWKGAEEAANLLAKSNGKN